MRSTRLSALLSASLAAAALLAGCPEAIGQHAPPPPGPALPSARTQPGGVDVLSLRRPDGPEWFGAYLMGKKIGWTRTALKREPREGRDVVVITEEALISGTVGTRTVERRSVEERVYEARPAGRLLTFRAQFSGDGGERLVVGKCSPSGCSAKVTGADAVAQERDLGAVVETLDLAEAPRLVAARRTDLSGPYLDLEKLKVRQREIKYGGRERLAGGGVETEVSLVTVLLADERIPHEFRVADDGRTLEVRMGQAILLRPESEAMARRLEAVDLFAMARIPLPGPLPRTVPATVVYRLSGLPASFRVPDGRQTFASGPDGTTLLTVKARLPLAADPAKDTLRATPSPDPELVAPDPKANADHPEVAALAKAEAGHLAGRYAAAVRLAEVVDRRVEQAYGASHDRASDVLASGKGDCTEHAVLFVALARALGIPARGVHGLVYARYADGQDALYWHAWAEVLSAGEWIAVDPTFGQPVADATHIKLGSENQDDAMGVLGPLKVLAADVKPER